MRILISISLTIVLIACSTKGNLEYITAAGERKSACETEYSGAPSVDKYAVEYILSYCARRARDQGHKIINERLLHLDLSIPQNPEGKPWTFEYATELYQSRKLTDKEYGYIIAYIDLGLNKAAK